MTYNNRSLLRLCDANLNRATEGLRVLEECARMLLNNAQLTGTAKSIRHDLSNIFRNDPILDQSLPLARDTHSDVLRSGATPSENSRADLSSMIRANARRAAEAVRTLEEYGKFISTDAAVSFKDIRFRIYDIEQQLVGAIRRNRLLAHDRLIFGLDIQLEGLTENIKDVVTVARSHGCGLIVLDGGSLNDCRFDDFVREAVLSANSDLTVLVRSRTDIALDSNADGVVLDAEGLRPSQCRSIGGYGMVIAYRAPDNTLILEDLPDDVDLVICGENIDIRKTLSVDRGIPFMMHCSKVEPTSGIDVNGCLFPFPDAGNDELAGILAQLRKVSYSLCGNENLRDTSVSEKPVDSFGFFT